MIRVATPVRDFAVLVKMRSVAIPEFNTEMLVLAEIDPRINSKEKYAPVCQRFKAIEIINRVFEAAVTVTDVAREIKFFKIPWNVKVGRNPNVHYSHPFIQRTVGKKLLKIETQPAAQPAVHTIL